MDTYGWDIVFVADMDTINTSLQTSSSRLVQSFRFDEQGYNIQGTFGSWSIVSGGSGKLLVLSIEIKSGQFIPPSAAVIDIGGLSVEVQVSLQLLPSPSTPGGQSLTFDFQSVGSQNSGSSGVVTPVRVNDPHNVLTPVQQSALMMAVATCLVNNASEVSYVFATINPSVANGAPWLKPAASSYCYAPIVGTNRASLAILSVTSERDITSLPEKVDPVILPQQGYAGFAIAPWLFMANVFVPGLAQAWNVPTTDFTVDGSGSLSNTTQIGLPSISKSGETYYPYVDSVNGSVQADHIALNLSGSCDMHMGISMSFSAGSNVGLSFDSGSKKLSMVVIDSPTFSKNVSIPWYDHLLNLIVAGVAEIILQVTTTVIGNELGDAISNITGVSNISSYAPNIVAWGGKGGFSPTAAGLSNALWMQGEIQ